MGFLSAKRSFAAIRVKGWKPLQGIGDRVPKVFQIPIPPPKVCTYAYAAEQKARSTYEYLIDLTDNPEVLSPLRFLREREIVHFQRFGEALEIARDYLNQEHYFFMQQNGCQS